MDAGAGDGAVAGFGDQHMAGAACGDLRAVGDDEYLVGSGQAGQALPDSGSDGAPYPAVDLVEDQRVRVALLRQRDLEREDEAGEFDARGDLDQRGEGRAGVRAEEHTSELQ